MTTLVIVQPYVPTYRRPFFDALSETLATNQVILKVAAGMPSGAQLQRGDVSTGEWLIPIHQKHLKVAGHSIGLGGSRPAWKRADAVIVGHLGSSLDTYQALLSGRFGGGLKVGVWGHIKSYVGAPHPLDASLERWQLKVADHVFAYTKGGADYALDQGIDGDKVTTVQNSVDSTELTFLASKISPSDITNFEDETGLRRGKCVAFVGGMDASKRIDFLSAALDELWRLDPSIKIALGGKGDERHYLDKAVARGQAVDLGYVGQRELALLGHVASAMLMPGRIGLIAVECLALRLPLVTTDWGFHAPEAEYLTEGTSRLSTADSPREYAAEVLRIVALRSNPVPLSSLDNTQVPTLEGMVTRFANGVYAMLDTPNRGEQQ